MQNWDQPSPELLDDEIAHARARAAVALAELDQAQELTQQGPSLSLVVHLAIAEHRLKVLTKELRQLEALRSSRSTC